MRPETLAIADHLESLIQTETNKRLKDLSSHKDKFENLKFTIEDIHKEAVLLYDNMKTNGFTANTLEAEGYLRCATTLLNCLQDIERE